MGAWIVAVVVAFTAVHGVAQTTITSPDGQWTVSVRSAENGTDELWIAATDGTQARLLGTARKFSSPQFSLDGAHVFVLTDISPVFRVLQRIEAATGGSQKLLDKVSRFALIGSGPNRGRVLVARRTQCFMEDLRFDCQAALLVTMAGGKNLGNIIATGKMVAKDDADFDELLEQLSR